MVGWPPIRSFRKNLSSTPNQAKAAVPEPQHDASSSKLVREKSTQNSKIGMFVKINMDGVPIGRKVDLKAYDSYARLSTAVDELFRGLLAGKFPILFTVFLYLKRRSFPLLDSFVHFLPCWT